MIELIVFLFYLSHDRMLAMSGCWGPCAENAVPSGDTLKIMYLSQFFDAKLYKIVAKGRVQAPIPCEVPKRR